MGRSHFDFTQMQSMTIMLSLFLFVIYNVFHCFWTDVIPLNFCVFELKWHSDTQFESAPRMSFIRMNFTKLIQNKIVEMYVYVSHVYTLRWVSERERFRKRTCMPLYDAFQSEHKDSRDIRGGTHLKRFT